MARGGVEGREEREHKEDEEVWGMKSSSSRRRYDDLVHRQQTEGRGKGGGPGLPRGRSAPPQAGPAGFLPSG